MEEELSEIINNPVVGRVATIAIGLAIIWVVIKTIQRSFFARIKDNSSRYKARKLSGFIGYLLTIILITVVYSDRLGGLTVALGVAGAGIAFALQEVITSFAGWLAILFGGFYKPGDRVQLGGIKGDVMDIGVLRTTVMETGQWVDGDLYNGRIVLIANSFVFKEPVFNYSGDFPFLWDEIKIPIHYGSDYGAASELIRSAGLQIAGDLTEKPMEEWRNLQRRYRLEDAQTAPLVSMTVNDRWVEYTLRYVVHYKLRRTTKTLIFSKILKEVEATNGKIKFAFAALELVNIPEIKVDMNK